MPGTIFGALIDGAINTANTYGAAAYNHKLNEQAADNADTRTRLLYNDLYSPEAKMRQLRDAGLNPGLMYATNGAGGTTSTSGAQGAGPNGPTPHNVMNLQGAMMNEAQIELMRSEARKNNAEADVTEETGKEAVYAEIAKALADAGNADASAAFTKVNTASVEIDNEIKKATKDFSIYKIEKEAEIMYYRLQTAESESKSARANAEVDEKTVQARIESTQKDVEVKVKDILLKGAQIKLDDAQVKSLLSHIKIDKEKNGLLWKQIDSQVNQWLEQNELTRQQIEIAKRGQNVGAYNATINAISHLISTVFMIKAMNAPNGAAVVAEEAIASGLNQIY